MKALDTNVLVRYLTQDDADQARVATRLVDDALNAGEPLYVSAVVMCEIVWVLESVYGFGHRRVATAIEALLRSAQLRFDHPARLWRSLAAYRDGRGDFADHLIGVDGLDAGASTTFTFDRALSGSDLFTVLKP